MTRRSYRSDWFVIGVAPAGAPMPSDTVIAQQADAPEGDSQSGQLTINRVMLGEVPVNRLLETLGAVLTGLPGHGLVDAMPPGAYLRLLDPDEEPDWSDGVLCAFHAFADGERSGAQVAMAPNSVTHDVIVIRSVTMMFLNVLAAFVGARVRPDGSASYSD